MEIASAKWLSEFEMEDPTFINQYNSLDYSLDGLNFQSFSSESYSSYPNFNTPKCAPHQLLSTTPMETPHHQTTSIERPSKQLKSNSWNSCTTIHDHQISTKASSSSSSHLISFENNSAEKAVMPPTSEQYYASHGPIKPKNEVGSDGNMSVFPSLISRTSYETQNHSMKHTEGVKSSSTSAGTMSRRTAIHAQDHVLAERKRREKLSQRFIALSAVVPGLKKASVLGDAIKYVKQLQERVNTLEEQAAKKTVESAVFVKRSLVSGDDELSSSDENFDSCSDQPLPEIEARVSDKDVLIRIHCEKHKGCLSNILSEVEKLPLTIVNSNVLPFGGSTLDITIVAQMDVEFSMNVKDIVRNLRQALLNFI
ncbi:hypothetical protein FEM48_Zijuj08G0136500 [Ziziphus jujuba var. spinosa]|uniref:BHLH domain-containing protein n=1 Tax=Ziziphus jujuba var. spinosa TaxID=714518 RepID=A0A978UZF2_ZIZJJ|nr:hypothetical protein FEM48_Zijuj08G0136500 [Ziziphus jujuba var. spinosa]